MKFFFPLLAVLISGVFFPFQANSASVYNVLDSKSPKWNEIEKNWIDEALSKIPLNSSLKIAYYKLHADHSEKSSYHFKNTANDRIYYFIKDQKIIQDLIADDDQKKEFQRNSIIPVIEILDRENQWSNSREWLSINRWKKKNSKWYRLSDSTANRKLAKYLGKYRIQTPRENLAVFLAHYLIEDIGAKADESLKCLYPAESRFAEKILRAMDPEFVSYFRQNVKQCPAYENWARTSSINYFEIILAAPSSVFIGSLFGHVFLRAQTEARGDLPAALTGRTFGFMAETYGLIENDPFYNIKGIFGLYPTVVIERDFSEFYRQYIVYEDRDMVRWKLNLTNVQKEILMERIWETGHQGEYPYYFFEENCGTFIYDLINGTLSSDGIEVFYPGSFVSMPAATIDGYLQTRQKNGESLLSPLDPVPGYKSEMVAARREIKVYLDRLPLGTGAEMAKQLKIRSAIFSGNARERMDAYALLSPDPGSLSVENNVKREILARSIFVEAYFSVHENVKKEKDINVKRINKLKKDLAREMKAFCVPPDVSRQLNSRDDLQIRKCEGLKKDLENENSRARIENYKNIAIFLSSLDKDQEVWKKNITHLTVVHAIYMYDLPKLLASPEGKEMYGQYIETIADEPAYRKMFNETRFIYFSQVSEAQLFLSDFSSLQPVSFTKNPSAMSSSRTGIESIAFSPFFLSTGNISYYGIESIFSLIDETTGEARNSGFPFYISMSLLKNHLLAAPVSNDLFYRNTFTFFDIRLLNPDTSHLNPGFGLSLSMDSEKQNLMKMHSEGFYGATSRVDFILPLIASANYQNYIFFSPGIMFRQFSQNENSNYFASLPLRLEARLVLIPAGSGLSYIALFAEYLPWVNILQKKFYSSFDSGLTLLIQINDEYRFPGSHLAKSLRFFIDSRYRHIYDSMNIHEAHPEEYQISAGFRLN